MTFTDFMAPGIIMTIVHSMALGSLQFWSFIMGFAFLSARERKPRASSDHFPCLSLSQSLLLFTHNQQPHIQNPQSKLSAPKNFPKISQKVPKELEFQKIQEFPKFIHLCLQTTWKYLTRAYRWNPFRACFSSLR